MSHCAHHDSIIISSKFLARRFRNRSAESHVHDSRRCDRTVKTDVQCDATVLGTSAVYNALTLETLSNERKTKG